MASGTFFRNSLHSIIVKFWGDNLDLNFSIGLFKVKQVYISNQTTTEKNTGVYLKKTVVELTKIFIKTQPTTLVVELMNKIRKSHFVINLTNLFVNITKKIHHYVNDAAFVDLTHLFVNPTKYFYKIFFIKLLLINNFLVCRRLLREVVQGR